MKSLGGGGRFRLAEDEEEEEEGRGAGVLGRRLNVGDCAERIIAPSYSDGS
jgi:hypothetical protein